MNDDIFTVTTVWTPVQANGGDITSGTFSMVNITARRVDFIKSNTPPAISDKGVSFIEGAQESNRYTLGPGEKLYAKTVFETTDIGVITA